MWQEHDAAFVWCHGCYLGRYVVEDGKTKLITNRLKVIGGRGPYVSDFDSGLGKDVVNKGVTLLSVFSLVGPVV